MVGEFDDQDAVLGRQAHQHQQAHLSVDIQGEPPQLQPDQCPHQGNRHGEQDDQRVDKAFVERRQQQIHHHHPEAEQHPG